MEKRGGEKIDGIKSMPASSGNRWDLEVEAEETNVLLLYRCNVVVQGLKTMIYTSGSSRRRFSLILGRTHTSFNEGGFWEHEGGLGNI